jgi:hypothetical protein
MFLSILLKLTYFRMNYSHKCIFKNNLSLIVNPYESRNPFLRYYVGIPAFAGITVRAGRFKRILKKPLRRTRRGQLGKKLIQPPPKVCNKTFTSRKGIIFFGWLLHVKSNIEIFRSQTGKATFFRSN